MTESIITELIGWAGISIAVSLAAYYLLNQYEEWRHENDDPA